MSSYARLAFAAALLLTVALTASAQPNKTKTTVPEKKPGPDNTAAVLALKEKRAQAVSLLLALASDARSFRDAQLRARSLARIADALWDVDVEQGRTLFRKAWEAAEVADRESDEKLTEEIRQQTASGHGYAFNFPPKALPEVLQLAERRDPALIEELRDELKAQEQAAANNATTKSAGTAPPDATSQPPAPPQPIGVDRSAQFIDTEDSLLDRIEHTGSSAERDSLYFQLAFAKMSAPNLRARAWVDEIEDAEFQRQARAFVDANLAIAAIEKRRPDTALQLIQVGELSHLQRAWVMARLAMLLVKTDAQKALSLIEDAGSESRRIEGTSVDRPRALLAVANALLTVDHDRVWDATFEAVKAANSAEGFTGEDGDLNLQFKVKGSNAASTHAEPDFDLSGIFAILGKEDYYRAVGLARGFQGEAPRAVAVIAIARAVLSEKKLPVPAKLPTTRVY